MGAGFPLAELDPFLIRDTGRALGPQFRPGHVLQHELDLQRPSWWRRSGSRPGSGCRCRRGVPVPEQVPVHLLDAPGMVPAPAGAVPRSPTGNAGPDQTRARSSPARWVNDRDVGVGRQGFTSSSTRDVPPGRDPCLILVCSEPRSRPGHSSMGDPCRTAPGHPPPALSRFSACRPTTLIAWSRRPIGRIQARSGGCSGSRSRPGARSSVAKWLRTPLPLLSGGRIDRHHGRAAPVASSAVR